MEHAFYLYHWESWVLSDAKMQKPDISFVPRMLRRRLSNLSKMTLSVAHQCIQKAASSQQPQRSIFASRHGEIHRTTGILKAIAQQETVSPTQFSLSVHNTAAGLHSIIHNETHPMTAIAARQDSFLSAMFEAIGCMNHRPDAPLLVVVSDEPLPSIYQPFIDEQEDSYAFALLLGMNRTTAQDLKMRGCIVKEQDDLECSQEYPQNALPQAIQFCQWLTSSQKTLSCSTQQRMLWQWNKD